MEHPPYSRVVLGEVRLPREPAEIQSGAQSGEGVDEANGRERQRVSPANPVDRNVVIVALACNAAAQRELAGRDIREREMRGAGDVVVVGLHDREAEVAI